MSGWRIVQEFTDATCPHCRGTGYVYGYNGDLGDCYHRSVEWVEDHDGPEPQDCRLASTESGESHHEGSPSHCMEDVTAQAESDGQGAAA